jgi:hypothetical protein
LEENSIARRRPEPRCLFSLNAPQPNPRGFWIACTYSGTSIVLSRRLPDEVKVCRVTYEKENREGPVGDIKKIDCR